MLLADAIDLYVTDRHARGEIGANTARQVAWRLGLMARACPGLDMRDLTRDRVLDWQRTVGGQRASTRRSYQSTLKTFCVWAVDGGLVDHDPTVRLAKVREPRPVARQLSDGELARLALVLPDERARLIVGLMRHGLRCVEVARLTAADYDPAGPRLWVWGKNDQRRRVPVRPWLAILLDRAARARPVGPLVGISAGRVSKLVSGWFAASGVKTDRYDGRSAHALRHTAAGQVLAGCGNVNTVKDFLGHQNLATTTRYLPDTAEESMAAAMAAGGI